MTTANALHKDERRKYDVDGSFHGTQTEKSGRDAARTYDADKETIA